MPWTHTTVSNLADVPAILNANNITSNDAWHVEQSIDNDNTNNWEYISKIRIEDVETELNAQNADTANITREDRGCTGLLTNTSTPNTTIHLYYFTP